MRDDEERSKNPMMDFDYDSVDLNAIRREVGKYMDDHVYNLEKSSFGRKFSVRPRDRVDHFHEIAEESPVPRYTCDYIVQGFEYENPNASGPIKNERERTVVRSGRCHRDRGTAPYCDSYRTTDVPPRPRTPPSSLRRGPVEGRRPKTRALSDDGDDENRHP